MESGQGADEERLAFSAGEVVYLLVEGQMYPPEVVEVSVENVLRDINQLNVAEQKAVLRELNRKFAVPLHNPESFFDDWNDREVDEAYDSPR